MQSDKSKRTDEEFLKHGSHFLDNAGKDKYSFHARLKALKTLIRKGVFEKPAGYDQKKIVKSNLTLEQQETVAIYKHAMSMVALGAKLEVYMPDPQKVKEAMQLIEKEEKNKSSLSKRFGSMMGFNSMEA